MLLALVLAASLPDFPRSLERVSLEFPPATIVVQDPRFTALAATPENATAALRASVTRMLATADIEAESGPTLTYRTTVTTGARCIGHHPCDPSPGDPDSCANACAQWEPFTVISGSWEFSGRSAQFNTQHKALIDLAVALISSRGPQAFITRLGKLDDDAPLISAALDTTTPKWGERTEAIALVPALLDAHRKNNPFATQALWRIPSWPQHPSAQALVPQLLAEMLVDQPHTSMQQSLLTAIVGNQALQLQHPAARAQIPAVTAALDENRHDAIIGAMLLWDAFHDARLKTSLCGFAARRIPDTTYPLDPVTLSRLSYALVALDAPCSTKGLHAVLSRRTLDVSERLTLLKQVLSRSPNWLTDARKKSDAWSLSVVALLGEPEEATAAAVSLVKLDARDASQFATSTPVLRALLEAAPPPEDFIKEVVALSHSRLPQQSIEPELRRAFFAVLAQQRHTTYLTGQLPYSLPEVRTELVVALTPLAADLKVAEALLGLTYDTAANPALLAALTKIPAETLFAALDDTTAQPQVLVGAFDELSARKERGARKRALKFAQHPDEAVRRAARRFLSKPSP